MTLFLNDVTEVMVGEAEVERTIMDMASTSQYFNQKLSPHFLCPFGNRIKWILKEYIEHFRAFYLRLEDNNEVIIAKACFLTMVVYNLF